MRALSVAVLCLTALLLAACHGGTLDSIYPGELGHSPPATGVDNASAMRARPG